MDLERTRKAREIHENGFLLGPRAMVQQFTMAGNMRTRRRKASPMGESARTRCKFLP